MAWEYSDIELGKRPRCPICGEAESVTLPPKPGAKWECGQCGAFYRALWVKEPRQMGITGGRVMSEHREEITLARVTS
jgi:ribosomal protein S27AE